MDTLRALIERTFRQVVGKTGPQPAFELRRATFRGKGLRPEFKGKSWEHIRDTIYRGRGS